MSKTSEKSRMSKTRLVILVSLIRQEGQLRPLRQVRLVIQMRWVKPLRRVKLVRQMRWVKPLRRVRLVRHVTSITSVSAWSWPSWTQAATSLKKNKTQN
jgi:hypothetical protein